MGSRVLALVLAASVALNAVLVARLDPTSVPGWANLDNCSDARNDLEVQVAESAASAQEMERELAAKERELAENLADLRQFTEASAEEISQVGQMFMQSRLSELKMSPVLQEELEYDNSTWGEAHPGPNLGLELLAVRLSASEKAAGKLLPETTARLADRLKTHGVAVVKSLIDDETCEATARAVAAIIKDPWEDFGSIQDTIYRKDLPLPLKGAGYDLLKRVMHALHPALEVALGRGAELTEFSTMTTFPTAMDQRLHSDSTLDGVEELHSMAVLYSGFIYLDDVTAACAPLDVLPGTHTHFHYLPRPEKNRAKKSPFVRVMVPRGSVAIFDSRVFHRGSGNLGPYTRPTVYFSLTERGKPRPDGPTFSLSHSYANDLVTAEDVLADHVPEPPEPPVDGFDKASGHDDALCRASLQKACSGVPMGAPLYHCGLAAFYGRPDHIMVRKAVVADFGEFDIDDDDDDLDDGWDETLAEIKRKAHERLPGCLLRSRIEKIAQRGIFAPDYVMECSYGAI